jgi:hypothetical protein
MEGQMPPAEGAPPEGGGEQEAAGALGELVNNVGQGLTMIADLVGKTQGAPPEAAQMAQGLLQGFQDLLGLMSGGAAPGGAAPAPSGQNINAGGGSGPMPPGMG